mgnify:CR=1 FL=1
MTRSLDSVSAISNKGYVVLPSQRITIPDNQCKTIVSAGRTADGTQFRFVRTVKATIIPNGVDLEEITSNAPHDTDFWYPVGRNQGKVGESGPRGTAISAIKKDSVELQVFNSDKVDPKTALVELSRTQIKKEGQPIPVVDSGCWGFFSARVGQMSGSEISLTIIYNGQMGRHELGTVKIPVNGIPADVTIRWRSANQMADSKFGPLETTAHFIATNANGALTLAQCLTLYETY